MNLNFEKTLEMHTNNTSLTLHYPPRTGPIRMDCIGS